jgi:hypothetical protein
MRVRLYGACFACLLAGKRDGDIGHDGTALILHRSSESAVENLSLHGTRKEREG